MSDNVPTAAAVVAAPTPVVDTPERSVMDNVVDVKDAVTKAPESVSTHDPTITPNNGTEEATVSPCAGEESAPPATSPEADHKSGEGACHSVEAAELAPIAQSETKEDCNAEEKSEAKPPVHAELPLEADQDNEDLKTPVSFEKTKGKALSPTAEPFVMEQPCFAVTPKKMDSPIAVDSVDMSGFNMPNFVTGNLPPMTPVRGSNSRTPRSQSTPRSALSVSPNVELSAKQVRELRRLCRKTANRAEYEQRLVQLRQIASILAMGGPSLVHFAPSYLSAHSAMQAWLDKQRSDGADWRDERPLSAEAVEELREWDRLLKAWAKRRFPTLADCSDGSAPPTTPRSKRVDLMSMTSPVSANSPSPARALVAQQVHSPASANRSRQIISGTPTASSPGVSMHVDGDRIFVSINPSRTPVRGDNGAAKSPWRNVNSPRRDKENMGPDGEASPRDWAALRKGGAASVNESTPLKTRNCSIRF